MYYYNIYKQLFAYGTAAIFCCLFLIVLTVDAAIISSSATDDHKSMPCLVDACTSTYKQSVNEIRSHGPSAIVDHCLLLNSYRLCLNDTFRHCLAQLDFHSATTTAVQRWHTFKCDDRLMITSSSSTGIVQHQQQFGQQNSVAIEPRKCSIKMTDLEDDDEQEMDEEGHEFDLKDEYYYSDEEETNHIHGSDEPNKLHKMDKRPTFCAIFGQLHLRPFHASSLSQIGQCSFVGARPLIDNPFFLIQITVSNLFINRNGQHNLTKIFGITKIAVIIRPKTGCFVGDRKLYLADTGDPNGVLPATFVDGTSNSGTDQFGKRAVEIEQQQGTEDSVKISMNHINTEILITSIGSRFFNIFVRLGMPKIQKRFRTSLCSQSCQNGVQMVEHSSAPLNFSQDIGELCSSLLDRRTAKEGAVPPNANRNNWISAICAQDLANASQMKEYFPMALWVDALFDVAEQLEESDHKLFNNISRKMSNQYADDNDDDQTQFIPSNQSPNNKLITDRNGINAKEFDWRSASVPKVSESNVIGMPSHRMFSTFVLSIVTLNFVLSFYFWFVCL